MARIADRSSDVRGRPMLLWLTLGAWAIFAFGIHLLVNLFNAVKIAGFPLGFYLAAQGSLVAFVIIYFLFARRMDALARSAGTPEDERP